jgi:hypothetical protein
LEVSASGSHNKVGNWARRTRQQARKQRQCSSKPGMHHGHIVLMKTLFIVYPLLKTFFHQIFVIDKFINDNV